MNTTYATAAAAIAASIEHNSITRCARTAENLEALNVACDDSADADEAEFWGEEDGAEWRVHVAAA